MLKFLITSLMASLVVFSFAEHAKAAKTAMVTIDGAMVYKEASFDAPVIAYLKKNKRIRVSSKTYGPFFKVKLRKGVIGYISDIDVKVTGGGRPPKDPPKDSNGRKDDPDDKGDIWSNGDDPEKNDDGDKPIYATRYIGLIAGIVNYSEEIFNPPQKGTDNLMTFGVKATGPELIPFLPYVLDINALFSFKAPSYYDDISSTDPSGLLILIDMNIVFPVMTGYDQNWMIYLGAGPLLVYSKFNITVNLTSSPDVDTVLDLQEFKFGGTVTGGGGYQFGDWAVKAEGKFFFEKKSYFSAFGSIQKKF